MEKTEKSLKFQSETKKAEKSLKFQSKTRHKKMSQEKRKLITKWCESFSWQRIDDYKYDALKISGRNELELEPLSIYICQSISNNKNRNPFETHTHIGQVEKLCDTNTSMLNIVIGFCLVANFPFEIKYKLVTQFEIVQSNAK